jgi:predicted acyltransferase
MVGVAMRFSFKAFNYELTPSVRNKILKRTLYLFLINYFVFYFPFTDFSFEKLRFLNVLPRIALSYCVVAFITLQVPSKWLTWINAGILLSFWGIMYAFGDAGLWMDISHNAVRKLDLFLFGESHLYHGNVVNGVRIAFDPEGFLSTLPAISTCLFGYQVSLYLENQAKEGKSALLGLLGWGAALILVAVIWDQAFPINKKLWTSSFVLICAGIDFILIGLLNWWIETKERHFGNTFFLVLGTNSILAYGISEIIAIQLGNFQIQDKSASEWLYWHIFEPIFGKYNGSLAYAIAFVMVCWSVCWVFWRKKWFLKV